jgi:hypothetical protein
MLNIIILFEQKSCYSIENYKITIIMRVFFEWYYY